MSHPSPCSDAFPRMHQQDRQKPIVQNWRGSSGTYQSGKAKGHHHQRKHSAGTILLAGETEKGSCQDIGNEEDGKDKVILSVLEVEVFLQASSLRIPQVSFIL